MKLWPLILLLVSCTTLTEDERIERRYEREQRYAEALDEFNQMTRECRAAGGTPMITRTARDYTVNDLRMAYCTRL